MKCEKCEIDYPSELIRPMMIGRLGAQSLDTIDVCGICALEIANQLHGLNRATFTTPGAEAIRLAAVEWRRKNVKNAHN